VRRLYDEMAGNWRMLGIIDWLLLVERLRKKQFASASGEVLDVGCGTGENFEFLTGADRIAALDLSTEMTGEAKRRADAVPRRPIRHGDLGLLLVHLP
jgi:ubiquinone/menaquinone biosynthesis C-methylase UbiE